jgi:hypothetical protein
VTRRRRTGVAGEDGHESQDMEVPPAQSPCRPRHESRRRHLKPGPSLEAGPVAAPPPALRSLFAAHESCGAPSRVRLHVGSLHVATSRVRRDVQRAGGPPTNALPLRLSTLKRRARGRGEA